MYRTDLQRALGKLDLAPWSKTGPYWFRLFLVVGPIMDRFLLFVCLFVFHLSKPCCLESGILDSQEKSADTVVTFPWQEFQAGMWRGKHLEEWTLNGPFLFACLCRTH